ncbi:MAG TPA: hypothetical protein VHJ20_04735 [Polyangia bacterium]|nr:hypothetical protein [Polyangia bacterium]
MPDPRLKNYAAQAGRHLGLSGATLAARQAAASQAAEGSARGNVPPWPRADDVDFHGTLGAVWIWARHHLLTGDARFAANRASAWAFVEAQGRKFIPEALDSLASDEGAYDCAVLLMAYAAERAVGAIDSRKQILVDRAARVLAAYLAELHDLSGREFKDPGFLAKALVDHARLVEDRGLSAVGRKFVERAFGMKAPPPFSTEVETQGGLFDFSSTTATRVLAVIAAEGPTPFVGAWLRERVAPLVPPAFVARRREENTWNACAAWALGQAYVVATDPTFLQAYTEIVDELERRDGDRDGALPRDRTVHDGETSATFYYALAVDALVADGR